MSEKSKLKVWSRFQVEKNGSVIKFRIQDAPPDRKEDVVDFIMTHLLRDEAFHKAAGIVNNDEAKAEFMEISKIYYEEKPHHISICCIDEDSDTVGEIIGLSIVIVSKNTDNFEDFVKQIQIKTKEMKNLFGAAKVLFEYNGPKNDYAKYHEGRGVVVRPDYRKMGIANEFIRLRKSVCIEHSLPMTCAWMTSIGTQKASDKNGWKTFSEVSVAELEHKTGLTYDTNVSTFKLMYTTGDF
ncbi:uncharacterized protein LOC116775677 [Danaus plexippus]|uniref:uncharacterized protein LOC116775677 n=1 Tax=Danaus plexippus TaxID=13037 RepID=UPI002AB02DAE|nr:uncharacterized protein LOC116775677 [Danaus plexippus]